MPLDARAAAFQLDAFAARRFAGNPAAVMLLDRYEEDAVLQALAAENNQAETAFLVAGSSDCRIRWFTPTMEVPLCGHATLASAAVVLERLEPTRDAVLFQSASGPLAVRRTAAGYLMDVPARWCEPIQSQDKLATALAASPEETLWDGFNYVVRLADAHTVRRLSPDLVAIAAMSCAGVIVTAPGEGGYDCVSRYFAPGKGIPDDPVTGGAHCALTPYWAARLGKDAIRAFQASARGGELSCRLRRDRVELEGTCVFYLEGIALW